jgi:DNA polymerase-1
MAPKKAPVCDGVCRKCASVSKYVKTHSIEGVGSKHPDIVFVGEYPDEIEDQNGMAFSGRGGQFFKRNILRPLQLDMSEIYLTYALKCWSSKKAGKNSTRRISTAPSRVNIIKCRDALEAELKALKPKVIVVMGNVGVCSAFYQEKVKGITKWRGKVSWSREFNAYIIPIYSPAALMFDRAQGINWRFDQTLKDVQLATEYAIKPKITTPLPKCYYITTEDKAIKYLKMALSVGLISLDSETDMMDPRNDILGISLGFDIGTKSYDAYIPYDVFESSKEAFSLLCKLCLNKHITKVLHNVDYDRKFFHYHGIELDGLLYDTMSMAHMVDENFPVGLKDRTCIDLDFGGYEIPLEKYKVEHKFTKNTSYKTIPPEVMAPYAALDSAATRRLYWIYDKRLRAERLDPLFYKISAPARTLLTDMSITGMHINMNLANKIDKRISKALAILEIQIYKVAGMTFNFKSNQQLASMLFNRLKAPRQGLTKGGAANCDKNALKKLSSKTGHKYAELARKVMLYKLLTKAQSTYITQLKDYIWDDGRVHSAYLQIGAATGRVSSVRPAILNIPNDKLIRMLYCATPGNKLIEIDVKSAEMRVIAALAKDQVLINIIKSGKDIHKLTACEIFGIKEEEVTDAQRRVAKTINFGIIYGLSAFGLSTRLEIDEDTAQKYIDAYFNKFKGVHRWLKDTVKFARANGYVESPFKRKRRLPDIKSDSRKEVSRASRQAMNAPVQSASADYVYTCLLRIDAQIKKRSLRSKIVNSVYDCALIDCPPSEVEVMNKIALWAFRYGTPCMKIPFDADLDVTEAWGANKKESALEAILKSLNC